jgi:hypothetical protein
MAQAPPFVHGVWPGRERLLNPVFLRQRFNAMLSAGDGARWLAHLAKKGDMLVLLNAVYHIERRFHLGGADTRGLSDHELTQYYVTGDRLAELFDHLVLQQPAAHNPSFNVRVKADKVEQCIAYLDRVGNTKADRRQLDAIYRWVMHAGDQAFDNAIIPV